MFEAYFHWKPCHAEELQSDKGEEGPYQVKIMKQIHLTAAQYRHFLTHLWEDMPFIADNKALMGCGKDHSVSHCLLVTTRNIKGGILVDCEGFDYARYAAEVTDKSALDLRGVPVDHYDLKLRQPPNRQEPR